MLNGPARNMEINNGNWRPRSAWDRAKRDFRCRNMVRLPDFDHLESTVVFTRGAFLLWPYSRSERRAFFSCVGRGFVKSFSVAAISERNEEMPAFLD